MAKINGRAVPEADGRSLADYVNEQAYRLNNIAVERNGEIVSKTDYEATILQPEDVLEIVQFVGGG